MIDIKTGGVVYLLFCAALAVPLSAYAQMDASINYHRLTTPGSSLQDIDLDAISGTVGYRYGSSALNSRLVLEGRTGVGVGVGEESLVVAKYINVTSKLKYMAGVNLRGELDVSDAVYLFVVPGITHLKFESSANSGRLSENSTEFSIGAGAGLYLGDETTLELGYESIDEADMLNLGIRFRF